MRIHEASLFATLALAFALSSQISAQSNVLQPGEEIVYDNTTTYLGSFQPLNAEYGDEITLAGTNRVVTEFAIEYFGGFLVSGNETARLRLYKNDGVRIRPDAVSPGTVLYDSGIFPINSGFNSRTVTGIAVEVPNDFTVTIEFGGLLQTPGDQAGLLFYSPPTIGQSFNDFWERTGTATWELVQTPNIKNNFSIRVIAQAAAPPPSPVAITDLTRSPGGATVVHFTGSVGESYTIQGSTNLVTWRSLGVGVGAGNGTFQFTDSSSAASAFRFYRIVPGALPIDPDFALTGLVHLRNAIYRLGFTGPASSNYSVQSSSDLKTWTTLGVATATGQGRFEFVDLNVVPQPRRFYRAIVKP